MRYLSAFLLGVAAIGIVGAIVFIIWGGMTYDNSRDWVNNPGKIPWLIGLIGGGGGAVLSFIGAGFSTLDKQKWGKSSKISMIIMALLFAGIIEVIASVSLTFYRS